jgi:hypothetical protein
MPNARLVFPAALAVIDRGIARLDRTGTPDPDAAQELLRLARAVELGSGEPCLAVRWLVRSLAHSHLVAA